MKKTLLILAFAIVSVAAQAQTVDPKNNLGSLFPQGTRSMIESRTAMRKGDTLTIVVSESLTGSLNSTTVANKKDSNVVQRSEMPILSDVLKWLKVPSLGVIGNKSSGATSTVSGDGTTTSTNKLNGRVAVTVREVMPNGNMVIEGGKSIFLNKDQVEITVTGIVRRDDVRPDNTVLSENVVDAQIKASGRGVIADRQRRGILTRIMDWLF